MTKYKVYQTRASEGCYSGVALFGAKSANDANDSILDFNFDSLKDGYTLCSVRECDALEELYTHRHGLITTNIIYTG